MMLANDQYNKVMGWMWLNLEGRTIKTKKVTGVVKGVRVKYGADIQAKVQGDEIRLVDIGASIMQDDLEVDGMTLKELIMYRVH